MESKLQQQVPQTSQINKPNLTGIPTQMKLDFEQRSGLSFDDVRVHYNSNKPAQLQALAYTQGTQVYIGPGQEQHLPHELGHVIQQKRDVYPSKVIGGIAINESPTLEKQADDFASSNKISAPIQSWSQNIRGSDVIQCKKGNPNAKVGVSISSVNDIPHYAKSLLVDAVSIAGRFDTGLSSGYQGDHTIADVLTKLYQKKMIQGESLPRVFEFYRNLAVTLHSQVTDAINKRGSSPRFINAQEESEKTIRQIDYFKNDLCSIPKWNIIMKAIIWGYNSAYAKGPYATQGKGSGGHGEADAIKRLKTICTTLLKGKQPFMKNADGTLIPGHGVKFCVSEIRQSQGWRWGTEQSGG